MDFNEIIDRVSAWDGVLTLRPGPGDGSPEISWGDVFFYFAPDGEVPGGQPFATLVTKDYPDDRASRLDREGVFRLSISPAKGRPRREADGEHGSRTADPSELDVVMPHPIYGTLGWVAVNNPGPRSSAAAEALLADAHSAARARWQRRHEAGGASR
jgi:hypothetical protein